MKNKEKYLEEILNAFASGEGCVLKEELGIVKCAANDDCDKCKAKTLEWLEQECIESIKLTHAEKAILENISKKFEYIARDKNDELYLYMVKPIKGDSHNKWSAYSGYNSFQFYNQLFQFVKWEDEEPRNIQELLENCEVV